MSDRDGWRERESGRFDLQNDMMMKMISRLYILTACWVSNSFSFLVNSLMSSMYIKRLIFYCDFMSLYPPLYFLDMWLSGIIAITNSKGYNASPWNIPFWIFTSAKLFPPAVNSTIQLFMVTSIEFMTLLDCCYFTLREFFTLALADGFSREIIIIIIIIILTPFKFFPPGVSMSSKWQQISYSSWS